MPAPLHNPRLRLVPISPFPLETFVKRQTWKMGLRAYDKVLMTSNELTASADMAILQASGRCARVLSLSELSPSCFFKSLVFLLSYSQLAMNGVRL